MFAPEAARGNDNTLWSTMAGTIRVLSRTYAMSANPIQLYELEIRDTWFLFILSAKVIDAHHPAQDRLTRLILWARELGVLKRTLNSSQTPQQPIGQDDGTNVGFIVGSEDDVVVQHAATSAGRIWLDLPFLILDLQDAWKTVMNPSEPANHRCNLASAIARLAGVGLLDEALAGCGLSVLSLALETPESESTSKGLMLQLSQLLPMVQIWLHYAGDKLLQLSLASHPVDDTAWYTEGSAHGQLACDAEIDTASLNRERFQFWKTRLSELRKTDHEATSRVADSCFNIIEGVWKSVFGLS
ncbi:uncharacterized protein LY89DRAFT_572236 [Mollisia scopiformis]|uniref:Uncharacterized protein n=1 Tax=Mollisia scopiformis TaxID=149040 RepID=A0A194XVJ6_MOLSC|nr:uncharacterized protein LY89DRAFT_572236 [Mollisia scopiformis]KUJ24034.1 hypothetical protein LY89DRAFT_572236 [Mollisia scopiformis]